MTEWNQFRKLDLGRVKNTLKSPKIIDLRNIYDPAAMQKMGFEYACVGRGEKKAEFSFAGTLKAPVVSE